MFVTYPDYVREKARELRSERRLSIDEIADRLALSRSTIYYMVRDLPLPDRGNRPRQKAAQVKGTKAMCQRWADLREAAYEDGYATFVGFHRDPLFRDFICLYIAEGYKRNRNRVSIANSDAAVLRLAEPWIKMFARNKIDYSLQYHADQNLDELRSYWSGQLDVVPQEIILQRKSNSNQLAGRTWRSAHGVMSVGTDDTLFRAELQCWIDCVRGGWL